MKKETKLILLSFFVSGGIFAGLMYLFDRTNHDELSIGKLVFYFLGFGLFMGIFSVYSDRKQIKKDENSKSRHPK